MHEKHDLLSAITDLIFLVWNILQMKNMTCEQVTFLSEFPEGICFTFQYFSLEQKWDKQEDVHHCVSNMQ